MLESIKDYLRRNASPELGDSIEQSDRLLERLGVIKHLSVLEELIQLETGTDTSGTLFGILGIYIEVISGVLSEHGVVVETQNLKEMNLILRGLLDIQNNEDAEFILATIGSDIDPVEKLSELLMLVTGEDCTLFHTLITRVNPRIFEMIKELVEPDLNLTGEAMQRLATDLKDRILYWIRRFPNSIASRFVNQQIVLGMSLENYMDLVDGTEMVAMDHNPPMVAMELLGLVFLSDTASDQILAKTNGLLDEHFHSLNHITSADNAVTSILKEYADAKA